MVKLVRLQPARRPAAPGYLLWTSDNLAIAVHFGASVATKALKSATVPGIALAPSVFSFACTIGDCSPVLIAAFNLSTMTLDVPDGTASPVQALARNPATPLSIIVGTFGVSASRSPVAVASARKEPSAICASTTDVVSIARSI
jgi:hypothetical protein